jgi:hypothetical protein
MQFIDFIANAYDMLTNYVATARYRAFLPCPMVVRGPSGGYVRGGPFHSQNPEAGFVHTPGLKVVYPSTAEDAKGLLKAAIRDDDCVLFFEHKYLYRRIKGEMPAGDHVVPIGKARLARERKKNRHEQHETHTEEDRKADDERNEDERPRKVPLAEEFDEARGDYFCAAGFGEQFPEHGAETYDNRNEPQRRSHAILESLCGGEEWFA